MNVFLKMSSVELASSPCSPPTPQIGEKVRKLATIVKIDEVLDHSNADLLAVARVRGWRVVTNKERDAYKAGDTAIYIEIDSIVPEEVVAGRAEHAILAKKNFVIKTAKIRGQLSQGILFRLDVLPKGRYEVGDDVTEMLNITKVEPKLAGWGVLRKFPVEVPKTDEERVQNIGEVLKEWGEVGMEFYVTEKVDGASITCYMMGDEGFGVCSRNNVVSEDTLHGKAAALLNVEKKMRDASLCNIALQGELLGPSIQSNRYKLPSLTISFFSAYDITAQHYLPYPVASKLVTSLGLSWVPVINPSMSLSGCTIQSLLDLAEGPSVLNKAAQREGLVFRSVHEKDHPTLGRSSFKAISNKYLLKYES